MYRWLLMLLLIGSVVEIWGIILVGNWLGGWNTFGLLVLLSLTGAYFAQTEGRKVWLEARRQLESGIMPGRSMIDGLCILAGGLLLLLPGFISDIAGLVLLLPFTRPIIRQYLLQWLEKQMRNGQFTIRRY